MRRRSASAAVVAAILVASVVWNAPHAAACSCVGFTDAEALAAADVVFTGDLVEVRTPPGAMFSSADAERFVFEVDRVYKGEARARQSVVTPREGASCGLELAGSGPFLVFASRKPVFDLDADEGELFSHLCTGSRSLSEVPFPAALGPGAEPLTGSSPVGGTRDGDDRGPVVVVGVAALLLAGALVVRWQRRARPPTS